MRITTHWASFSTSPASTISDGDSPTPETPETPKPEEPAKPEPEKPEEPAKPKPEPERPERTANPGTSGKSCESDSSCGTRESCNDSYTLFEGPLLGIKRCMVENERPKGCSYSGPHGSGELNVIEKVFIGYYVGGSALLTVAKRLFFSPPSK